MIRIASFAAAALLAASFAAPAQATVRFNGLDGMNGISTANGLNSGNGLDTHNGVNSANGLGTDNGFSAANGVKENGLNTTNGSSGSNGIALHGAAAATATLLQGITLPNGVTIAH